MREIRFRAWLSSVKKMAQLERLELPCSDTEKMKIMQYTGLKDRNGKEIYEGDIVTLPIEPNATLMQAVIEWDYDGWKMRWLKNRVKAVRGKEKDPIFRNIYLFEVIGSIYENPELLERSE